MNRLFSIFLVALGLMISGCQPHPSGGQAPKPGAPGTIDSGGQHGSEEGLPLDRYRVNELESFPEVSQGVIPVLNNLYKINRTVAGRLLHILRQRSWFILPARLDDIPSHTIGAIFPTVQIAHHRQQEIWIDSRIWEKLSFFDRKMILIHELTMGAFFQKFQSHLDQCLAGGRHLELPILAAAEHMASLEPSAPSYDVHRKQCIEKHRLDFLVPGANGRTRLQISEEQYSAIRKLSSLLIHHEGRIDAAELEMLALELEILR